MEQKHTRDVIIDKALELFSVRGYESTTVAQIAQAVGISAPALYKHFTNKEAIFNAIIDMMSERYAEFSAQIGIDGNKADTDADIYRNLSVEAITAMGIQLFQWFLHDEYTARFRRLLQVEQYRNPEVAAFYLKQYYEAPIAYQGYVFDSFAANGKMKKVDGRTAALEFYGPLFLMLTVCDSQPQREPEMLEVITKHIQQFAENYILE